MAYNETGHAVNVANFKELISFAVSLGDAYKPPVNELSIVELKKQADNLDISLQEVNIAQANNKKAIYERQKSYESINQLVSRIISMLSVLGVDAKVIKEGRSIISKITGASKKKSIVSTDETTPTPKTNSTSQMSFDQRKNNFERLVSLLQAEPLYKSNEPDLEITALQKYSKSLSDNTMKVLETEKELDVARQKRDDLLYIDQIGAVDIGLRIKQYIKSKYSATSSEFKRIQAIKLISRRTTK